TDETIRRRSSACRVEQSAHRLCFCELVVKLHGFGGGQYMRCDLTLLQEIQSLTRNVKAFLHSPREHDDFCAVIEQFLYVGWLNARRVLGPTLPPIPFTRSAREKLCILIRFGSSFHLESPPGYLLDPRRTMLNFHSRKMGAPMRLCRGSGEPLRFAAFVLVEESDELASMGLFLSSDFQNEILRHQINRITHLDQFLVLIDRFLLGADHTANHCNQVLAVVRRLQI